MITYVAIALAVIIIVALGLAYLGWHRHLRNDEDWHAPSDSSPATPKCAPQKGPRGDA